MGYSVLSHQRIRQCADRLRVFKNRMTDNAEVKDMRFPVDVILVCMRWYAAYPLSYLHLGEMMAELGV